MRLARYLALVCTLFLLSAACRPLTDALPVDASDARHALRQFSAYLHQKYVRGKDAVFSMPLHTFFMRASTQGDWYHAVWKDLKGYFPFDPNLIKQAKLFFDALVEGTWFDPQNNGTCRCCDPNNPLDAYNVHIALTGNAGEIVVTYNTQERPNRGCISVSEAGASGSGHEYCTTDVRTTSTGSGFSPFLCEGWSGYASHVKVSGLTPGKKYTYTIPGSSRQVSYSFQAPYGNTTKTARLAYFTDIGTKGGEPTINALMSRSDDFDFMIMPGDQSYCEGYSGCTDKFMQLLQPLAAQKPYVYATGNHEGPWNFTYVRTNMYWPVNESGAAPDALWYSIDEGPVHFVMMNYENYLDYPDGEWSMTSAAPISTYPGQMEWLRQDLEAFARRREQDPDLWLIVLAHRPIMCNVNSSDCQRDAPELIKEVFPLLLEYKADMYWCGHVHVYERIHPISNATGELCSDCIHNNGTLYVKPPYPVQTVNGIAGRAVADDDGFTPGATYPDFVAKHYSSIDYPYAGYSLVQVDHKVLKFTAYNTSGEVIDHFEIQK